MRHFGEDTSFAYVITFHFWETDGAAMFERFSCGDVSIRLQHILYR